MKKDTIIKILKRIKPFRTKIIFVVLFAVVSVTLSLYIPILVGRAIDYMIGVGNVEFSNITQTMITLAVCALAVAVSQWCLTRLNNKITYAVVKQLRDDMFKHIQRLPIKYLDSHSSGSVVSNIVTDVDQFSDGLLLGFTQFLTGALTIVGTLCFMLSINWIITLVVVLITPMSFFVASFIAKKTHKLFKSQSEIRAEQTAIVEESLSDLKLVKAFSHEDEILEKFDEVNENLRAVSQKAIFYSSLTNPVTRFVNSVVYAGVGLSGALVAVSGGISVGALTSFLTYANQYTKPFNEISGVFAELQNAIACAQRVFDLLEQEELSEEVSDKDLPKTFEGNIEIENVSFSYIKDKELIKDFNLSVKSGQKIAIVGPTGCGKTTMINLLMRFYDIDSGDIKIDGVSIRDMSRHKLRSSVGMVLQDTWLKAGTIRENICMGKKNVSDAQLEKISRLAHAHSFIRRLPKAYDTVIGESGGSLSQGQKQLLCIARLMLALPPMLILDEAT
ncbi:MAG: ABC transporter ATP-binding protein, partial [Clostridia bacterium]